MIKNSRSDSLFSETTTEKRRREEETQSQLFTKLQWQRERERENKGFFKALLRNFVVSSRFRQ